MEILHADDTDIEMQLHFFKPFKSKAKVVFTLEAHEGKTEVIWHMYGHLPFFLFWMTSKMQTYIRMDYARGLAMLKEYIETGSVSSSVQIEGVALLMATCYIGISTACS